MAVLFDARREKYQSAILDYKFDWSDWLESPDTIVSAVVTAVPSDLGVGVPSNTTSEVVVRLAGGTPGVEYEVTCRATAASGQVDDGVLRLYILD